MREKIWPEEEEDMIGGTCAEMKKETKGDEFMGTFPLLHGDVHGESSCGGAKKGKGTLGRRKHGEKIW